MNRVAQANQILADLGRLEAEWTASDLSTARQVALREQRKCLKAQLAVVRALQSERRPWQPLSFVGIGLLGGALLVAVLQRIL